MGFSVCLFPKVSIKYVDGGDICLCLLHPYSPACGLLSPSVWQLVCKLLKLLLVMAHVTSQSHL